MSDFIIVKNKKFSKNRAKYDTKPIISSKFNNSVDTTTDCQITIRDLELQKLIFREEKFYQDILKILIDRDISTIVCLGLGRFSCCPIARHQLIFLLNLREDLEIQSVFVQDPVFSANQTRYLKDIGIQVLEQNIEGKFQINLADKYLFYLPHCPKQLTNNLLWKNWNKESLKRVTLICNSFENLITTKLDKILEIEAKNIVKIQKFTTEFPITTSEKYFEIFNDTSVHLFDQLDLPIEFWTENPEPIYPEDDLELITKKVGEELKF